MYKMATEPKFLMLCVVFFSCCLHFLLFPKKNKMDRICIYSTISMLMCHHSIDKFTLYVPNYLAQCISYLFRSGLYYLIENFSIYVVVVILILDLEQQHLSDRKSEHMSFYVLCPKKDPRSTFTPYVKITIFFLFHFLHLIHPVIGKSRDIIASLQGYLTVVM